MLSLSAGRDFPPTSLAKAEASGSDDKSTSGRSSRWYKNASIYGMAKKGQFWEEGVTGDTFTSDPLPSSFTRSTLESASDVVNTSAAESNTGERIRLAALCFS